MRLDCLFSEFYQSCKAVLTNRWVTLQVPQSLKDDYYDVIYHQYAQLEDTTIDMPDSNADRVKEIILLI